MNKVGSNVQYLVLERRGSAGATETRASLSFDGARQGVASWLGTPGPMGSLNFVSPDASLAASFVMKSPRAVMEEAIGLATQRDSRFPSELSAFEAETGVSVLDDVAAPLGSDATFAIDGPLLPVPSWKLAIEVNDPIAIAADNHDFDRPFQPACTGESGDKVQAGSEQINSQTFYWLRGSKLPNLTFYYTFVDGYLLAGANETSLLQAIQNRQNANTLVNSANFRNQLPADSYTNFSGLVYTNAGSSFGPLVQQLKGSSSLTPAQQQSLSALLASSGPALVCIYGEPDRIVAASRGSFLGFDLGTLIGNPARPPAAAARRFERPVRRCETLSRTARRPSEPPVIELRGLSVRLGTREVLRDLSCSFSGTHHRPARPQRRGQIHPDQYAARTSGRPPPARRISSDRTSAPTRARFAASSATCPRTTPSLTT